jgi:hypothetical protein
MQEQYSAPNFVTRGRWSDDGNLSDRGEREKAKVVLDKQKKWDDEERERERIAAGGAPIAAPKKKGSLKRFWKWFSKDLEH